MTCNGKLENGPHKHLQRPSAALQHAMNTVLTLCREEQIRFAGVLSMPDNESVFLVGNTTDDRRVLRLAIEGVEVSRGPSADVQNPDAARPRHEYRGVKN